MHSNQQANGYLYQTMKFKNKIVLVTGAGSGIGRGTALAFAREGATVVVSDINEAGGQETVELIGASAIFIKADVADFEQVGQLVQAIVAKYDRLDIAINNAWCGRCDGQNARNAVASLQKSDEHQLGRSVLLSAT